MNAVLSPSKSETLERKFHSLLKDLSQTNQKSFSGVGIILYDHLDELSNYHCSLVKTPHLPNDLTLGTGKLISYLEEIAAYQHPLHDGFHFINAKGALTHVAQFVSPPIPDHAFNLGRNGARTFCSQCVSLVNGVNRVGSVSSTGQVLVFQRGIKTESAQHVSSLKISKGHTTLGTDLQNFEALDP